MAKKSAVRYVCSNCGQPSSSWSGRCPHCGEWNTLEEQIAPAALAAVADSGHRLVPQDIATVAKQREERLVSGIAEVDDVLGGGVVPGSVTLLAGQPGIGKSTLLMQFAHALSASAKVLYVSGEESAHQVASRASRLKAGGNSLQLATSTSADDIAATIASGEYQLVVIDSIQTLSVSAIASAAGSVSQITNSTQLLTAAAKQADTALLIVGHVTKEGSIAGPKVLEHVVDVVLQLEGDRYGGV